MKVIGAVLITTLALGACSPGGEPPADESFAGTAVDSSHADHASTTADAAHTGHDTAAAGDHDGHDMAADEEHAGHQGVTENAHAGHTMSSVSHDGHTGAAAAASDHAMHRPATGGGHEGHESGISSAAHAGHAASADASHAAHPDTAGGAMQAAHVARDTSHAGHAARVDTHAAHDAAPAGAHAAHVAVTADTSHAAHDGMRDTTHAQHAASAAAHAGHAAVGADTTHAMEHEMAMFELGPTGWMAIGMAQVFPTFSMAFPSDDDGPLAETGFYATQPAIMINFESPQSRVSFRTTLNFEGLTQEEGELTFGGWGEGFLDKRHPHTLLHEAMLSVNVWSRDDGGFSLSAGKGFAPYGTDDPMSRPVLKYPTNHHLSQILERFTLNGVYSSPRWSVEVGVFGGNEPTSPYDFSNAESFANSFSTRVARRFGNGAMGIWDWELAGSYGYVVETHDDQEAVTRLYNAALRHEHDHSFGRVYSLIEASLSDPAHHDGYFSVLAEASVFRGRHNPYGRFEYATRPEYPREGEPGTDGFFRYDHDDEPLGSTRWLIATAGYGFTATSLPFSARPYVEVQWNRVAADDGDIDPDALFGRSSFFGLSAGARLFLGGEPMRMGSYGVLDSMTLMHRMQMEMAATAPASEHAH